MDGIRGIDLHIDSVKITPLVPIMPAVFSIKRALRCQHNCTSFAWPVEVLSSPLDATSLLQGLAARRLLRLANRVCDQF